MFKPGASVAAKEFCEWFQVAIDVYVPHGQVRPHSYPCSSAACAAAIVLRSVQTG